MDGIPVISKGGARPTGLADSIMYVVFLVAALVSVVCVALICLFLFVNGIPPILKIGLPEFITGLVWQPASDTYGIGPMIIGSLYVTAGAMLIGAPLGVLTAVFLARFCPARLYRMFSPAVSLLAGIPSVVYGFFGLVLIVPIMQDLFGVGKNILTASILLGIMILPTIISVSEAAIRAVPDS
jgi:phosphate transport system permease protein